MSSPDPDSFFLTEAVTLDDTEFVMRGIGLDKDRKEFQYDGEYSGVKHFAWVELRRRQCQQRRWLAKDIINFGADIKTVLKEHLLFSPELMKIVWDNTDSPTGTPINQIKINKDQSAFILLEIQLPAISWLHEKELIRIAALQKELHPNRENPDGKNLWDHAVFCQRIITGWFIRNKISQPKIDFPELRLTLWDYFCLKMEEALQPLPWSKIDLWAWKDEFEKYPGSYFKRYEREVGPFEEGPGSGNALEWRKNPKFRLKRGSKTTE